MRFRVSGLGLEVLLDLTALRESGTEELLDPSVSLGPPVHLGFWFVFFWQSGYGHTSTDPL